LDKLPLECSPLERSKRGRGSTRAAMRSARAILVCALVLAGVASISTMPVKKEHKNNDDIPNAAAAPKTAITIPCAVLFAQFTVYARICSLTYIYIYIYIICTLICIECVLLQVVPFAQCTVDAGCNSKNSHA
jgi:hypothetical protein